MKKLALTAVLLAGTAFVTLPAQADSINIGFEGINPINWNTDNVAPLSLTPVVPGGNQPTNIVCVICGDNQPQQGTFGYTNFHNTGQPGQDLRYFSTNVTGGGDPGLDQLGIGYDGSFLRAYLLANGANSLQFNVGIDVNDTNNPQVLESFFLLNLSTHTVLAAFSPGPGGTPLVNANNGTGFPDWTLSGFDITPGIDISAGDKLIFYARLSNANDGPDSFFLVPNAVAVPGPIAGAGIPGLIGACTGLFGLNFWRRRRNGASLAA